MIETGVIPASNTLRDRPSTREQAIEQMRFVLRYMKRSDALRDQLAFCAADLPFNLTEYRASGCDDASRNVSADVNSCADFAIEHVIYHEYESLSRPDAGSGGIARRYTEVDWYSEAQLNLFLFGLVLRAATLLLFYKRTSRWEQIPCIGVVVVFLRVWLARPLRGAVSAVARGTKFIVRWIVWEPAKALLQCLLLHLFGVGKSKQARRRSMVVSAGAGVAVRSTAGSTSSRQPHPQHEQPGGWLGGLFSSRAPDVVEPVPLPPPMLPVSSRAMKMHRSMRRLVPRLAKEDKQQSRSHKELDATHTARSAKDRPPRRMLPRGGVGATGQAKQDGVATYV